MRFKDYVCLLFVTIYGGLQWVVIHNPGLQDDVVSARVQDIMVIIVSSYFVSKSKDSKK